MTRRIDPDRPPAPDPAHNRHGEPRRRAPRARRPVAITPAMLDGAPEFAPVPRGSSRYDGWTPDRQRAFIKMLAELGCVTRAAKAVGMTEVGAYLLRKAEGGEGFARAWEEAQSIGIARLSDVALERALHGIPVPIYHKGEQVGERRWYDNRLLSWVLRYHDPERYGGPIGHRVPPHIRAGLRAEWERERAEQDRERSAGARERLAARIEEVRRRMGAGGEGVAPPPEGGEGAAEPRPEAAAPAPLSPETRAECETRWAERDAERGLAEQAEVWAQGDPRDGEENAAAHWRAMMAAGRIGE